MNLSVPTDTETPRPDDVHYSAKVSGPDNTREAAQHWVNQAHRVMLYELAEEINAGEYRVGSNWWKAQVHKRALELIEQDETLRPAYKTGIAQSIEDNALYHYAGYESAEEWLASEASLKRGGQRSDYRFWASKLIPWCKTNKVWPAAEVDRWFFTPINGDGSSRMAPLRDVTPDLRDIIERDVYPDLTDEEKIEIVRNILLNVADPSKSRREKQKDIGSIRCNKMVITIKRNGDGDWHIEGILDDPQKDRLEKDLEFSAILEYLTD